MTLFNNVSLKTAVFFITVSFFVGATDLLYADEYCEFGSSLGGDQSIDGYLCVTSPHYLEANYLKLCDEELPFLADIKETNSFVFRSVSDDIINNTLSIEPTVITAHIPVTVEDNLTIANQSTLFVTGTMQHGASNAFIISGAKVLTSTITTTSTTVLTVNFSEDSAASLVHVVLFGNTGTGDIKYDAWIYLATGNSIVKSSSRDVTAGSLPTITVGFSEATGIASFTLNTAEGESITSPYVFYEVYGNKISSVV